ncbi:uncharacterized protein LOC119389793 [Rhipicephalus sanguineus]|uniref:Uncharacterized protein n=1 Tax=Rhipicephalus sanguineus TaxID=34632 RepID=A0A9D4PWL6_RHISA|nr:uncharacterized protein LOC119389793 [Rhipicephalus sanguineus]KAH7957085.1 hypothetical protein HPB52_015112 [Rhipicephalus sanguineus]
MQRHETSEMFDSDAQCPDPSPAPTETPRPTAFKPLPPKVKRSRRRRKKSRMFLVPYEPTLSPIFEESQRSSRELDAAVPCSQPLLYVPAFARYPTYGVITPRLNRVVIAIEEEGGDKAWPERVARILTLSWFLTSISALVLLGGATMIWMAFDGEDDGDVLTHRNVVTAFVGVAVILMAVLFVLWNVFRGLR